MKKLTLAILLITTFLLGYSVSRLTTPNTGPRVTGIGGIFFKAKDPATLKAWYSKNLGLKAGPYGATFEWHQGIDSAKKGFTQWTLFKETTKYFQPSEKQFMINYRVEGLDQLLAQMKTAGITPVDTLQKTSYGKFIHLLDPEGNKIELWEPIDTEYGKMATSTIK